MGYQYEWFTAADDAAAIAAFSAPVRLPSPSLFSEDVRLDLLGEIEHILTGRATEDIAADPRYIAQLAQRVDEDTGMWELSLSTITDSFTTALAAADLSQLPQAYQVFEYGLQELALIARHAVTHGHHMYCAWGE